MVIAIWSGISKPKVNEYIELLIGELQSILPTGLIIKGHHVAIKFGRVVCDTPARSLMKGTTVENYDAIAFCYTHILM